MNENVVTTDILKLTEFFSLLIEIDRKEVKSNENGIQKSNGGSLNEGLQKIALRSNKTRHPRAKIKS